MYEKIHERKLEREIRSRLKRKEILIIRGPRQAGKTTLLKVIESGIKGSPVQFFNLDIPDTRKNLENTPIDFVKKNKKGGKLYLILDEVQRLKSGEPIKIIYDEFPGIKMLASGSSSMEIKSNILPFLVGRAFIYELLTFDFGEYIAAMDADLSRLYKEKHNSLSGFINGKSSPKRPSFVNDFLKLWKQYAIYGGYPEVIKAKADNDKRLVLNSIRNLYLERDVTSFFRIEDTGKFEDLAKSIAYLPGTLISYSAIGSDLGLSFRKVEEYMEILKGTFIIHVLRSFHKNIVTEIRKSPKIFFTDQGLRNSIIGNFSEFDSRSDMGPIMENFVFRQLLTNFPDWDLRYWRTAGKAEVDFVLSRGDDIIPIEVKLGKKVERGFYSFLEAYKPKRAIVATLNHFGSRQIGKTRLYFIPVWYF